MSNRVPVKSDEAGRGGMDIPLHLPLKAYARVAEGTAEYIRNEQLGTIGH